MAAPYRLFRGRLNVAIISIFAASASLCAVYKLFALYSKLKVVDSKKAVKNSVEENRKNGKIQEQSNGPKEETNSKKNIVSETLKLAAMDGALNSQQVTTLITFLTTETDEVVLKKILTTIANACAFKHNQDLLRESNGIEPIVNILHSSSSSIFLKASCIHAISNLSLNNANNIILQRCIPDLCNVMLMKDASTTHMLSSLQALTNLSLVTPCSSFFHQSIQYLFDLLGLDNVMDSIKLQVLKVLVNLSCDDTMIDSLLKAEPPAVLLNYLQPPVEDDHALRVLTFLANVTQDTKAKERVEQWRESRNKLSTVSDDACLVNCTDDDVRIGNYHKPLSIIEEEDEEVEITENGLVVKPGESLQSLDLVPDNTLYDMVHGNSSVSLRCYVMLLKLYDQNDIQIQANRLWNNLY